MKKYTNASYAGDVIYIGGEAVPVNRGVITLSPEDQERLGAKVVAHGFELMEETAVNSAEKPNSDAVPVTKTAVIAKAQE